MDLGRRFFQAALIAGAVLCGAATSSQSQILKGKIAVAPKPTAQTQSGKLSGTWLLTGQYFASGAPLPPTADLNNNDMRETFIGEDSGNFTIDQPLRYGDNGKIELTCRAVIAGKFALSHEAGLSIAHFSNVVETTGKTCGPHANVVTKLPLLTAIIEVSGDSLKIINGLKTAETPGELADMAIYTYKRINP